MENDEGSGFLGQDGVRKTEQQEGWVGGGEGGGGVESSGRTEREGGRG